MRPSCLMSPLIITTLFLLIGCVSKPTNYAHCRGTIENPCLVRDKETLTDPLKHYRDTSMIAKSYHGNTAGLDHLWISGSAVPSAHDFNTIKERIKAIAGTNLKHIIDLDLREESHGYLNAAPITLAAEKDWININKNHKQVLRDEKKWLSRLSKDEIIENVLTPDQFKNQEFTEGSSIPVSSVTTEQQLASDLGYQYNRLTITDHLAPRPEEVDRFVSILNDLPKGTWIYVHCRGGKGRTTTFLAMYDMFINADKATFNDIIERQASVDPFYNLYNTDPDDSTKIQHFEDRLTFLKKFYQFSNDHLKGDTHTWSQWLTEHHVLYPKK